MRVDVRVVFDGDQQVLATELLKHQLGGLTVNRLAAREETKPLDVATVIPKGRNGDNAQLPAQCVVDIAATWRDVNNAGSFPREHHGLPGGIAAPIDHAVAVDARAVGDRRIEWNPAPGLLGGQLIEWATVLPAHQLGSRDLAQDLVATVLLEDLGDGLEPGGSLRPAPLGASEALFEFPGQPGEFEVLLGEVIDSAVLLGLESNIGQLRIDRGGHVAGERPGGGGPDQQVFVVAAHQREPEEHRAVDGQLATFGHLHLAVGASPAARPRHDIMSAVQLAPLVALLEERPDGLVILGRESEVAPSPGGLAEAGDQLFSGPADLATGGSADGLRGRLPHVGSQLPQRGGVVPIHPVSQADRLLGLPGREGENPLFAGVGELVDAKVGDRVLGAEAEFLFHLDFHPQPLAVKAVLVPQFAARHGEVALIGVFVGATPGVVDAHGVVGGDRPVEEAPAGSPGVLSPQLGEDLAVTPEPQDIVFAANKTGVGGDFFEHGSCRRNESADGRPPVGRAEGPTHPGPALGTRGEKPQE